MLLVLKHEWKDMENEMMNGKERKKEGEVVEMSDDNLIRIG